MTILKIFLLPIALLAAPLAAHADDWKDEAGNRRYDRAPKEVFWEGNCRVERKINRHGELVERRRCRRDRDADARLSGDAADGPERGRFSDDDQPRRSYDYRESRRYSDDPEPQPARHSGYRDQRSYDTPAAAAPVLRYGGPPAPAPRIAARPVPAVKVRRIIAKPATAIAPRRLAAKAVPVVQPPRVVARAIPAPKPSRIPARHGALVQAPRTLAKVRPTATAPRAIAKAEPVVEAPRVTAKAAPAAKTPANHPQSDWLVMLPPEQAKAKTAVKPALASEAPPAVTPRADAKAERAWELREFEEYFKKKSRDPYSNLR